MANNDVAIPLVFPDYLIAVDTPEVKVNVPDVLPWVDLLPNRVTIPATKQKVPYLGHAGILFFQGSSGITKYYEYGRYDPAAHGLVRKQSVSDVKMASNGRPTQKSLDNVLGEVSRKSGQAGRITGAYVELAPGAFIKMLAHATTRMKDNTNPRRTPYDLFTNSCLHFMKAVAEAGGAPMPAVIAPQPAGYIVQVRLQMNDLDYARSGKVSIQNIELK